jgi:hypothetical protein
MNAGLPARMSQGRHGRGWVHVGRGPGWANCSGQYYCVSECDTRGVTECRPCAANERGPDGSTQRV